MHSVLVVDDEPMARLALTNYLGTRSDICQLESARDAIEALEMMTLDAFDVVFLDMKMPEMSGIEMLDALNKRSRPLPSVVFTTAYDEFTIQAFERNAVDYLLKPFSAERVEQAMNAALERRNVNRLADMLRHLSSLHLVPPHSTERIALKDQGRVRLIEVSEVLYIESEGNYVLFHMKKGTLMIRDTMTRVERRLQPHGFVRIHRSVIVNRDAVSEFHPWYTGEYVLKLRTGKEFTVTRTFKHNLALFSAAIAAHDSSQGSYS
jgi:two-component system, LytTR family, response regulator